MFNFFFFVKNKYKKSVNLEEIDSCIRKLKSLNMSIQHCYVFYQSKIKLSESQSWMDLKDLKRSCKFYIDNSTKWISYLSPYRVPNCIANYSQLRWKNNFYYYCATLQQNALLASIISTIPTPRTNNIQNLCFYFRRSEPHQELELE